MPNQFNEDRTQTTQARSQTETEDAGAKEGMTARARRMASDAQSKVRDEVRQNIDSERKRTAGTLDGVAQSLLSSAEHSEGIAGRYIERAGHQVQRLSDYLEDTDVRQLMAQTERFARREPLLFLGSAFAIGLVAARYLKSSQRALEDTEMDEDDRPARRDASSFDRERPLPEFRENDRTDERARGDTGIPSSTGNNPASNPKVGNAPGGEPISAAGRDFTDVDPSLGKNSLHAGGTNASSRTDPNQPGSSSETDRH